MKSAIVPIVAAIPAPAAVYPITVSIAFSSSHFKFVLSGTTVSLLIGQSLRQIPSRAPRPIEPMTIADAAKKTYYFLLSFLCLFLVVFPSVITS